MRRVVPVLNPEKDMSAAHAFDGSRMIPRAALEVFGIDLPWGEHPDDDMFLTREISGTTEAKAPEDDPQ